jgi:hypothetical protein
MGGKVLNLETGISTEKLLQGLALVGTPGEMPNQVAEEQTHFFLPNIVVEEVVVEVQWLPFRAD